MGGGVIWGLLDLAKNDGRNNLRLRILKTMAVSF